MDIIARLLISSMPLLRVAYSREPTRTTIH